MAVGRTVGPGFFPLGTLIDPAFNEGDFGLAQRRRVKRHSRLRVVVDKAFDQLRRVGVAGHDGGFARLGFAQGFFPKQQTKAAQLFDAPVADHAVFVEDRPNLLVVADFLPTPKSAHGAGEKADRREQSKKDEAIHGLR